MVNGFGAGSVAHRLSALGTQLVGTVGVSRPDPATVAGRPGGLAARAARARAAARDGHRRFVRLVDPPGPHGRATEVDTLSGALRRFLDHPRPPVLLGVVGALGAARAVRGDFRASDAVVAVGAAAAQPFVEWSLHRYVLHATPESRLGSATYRGAGWGHAQHHRDPANLNSMFLRAQEVLVGGAVALAAGAAGSPRLATGMFCVGAAVLAYDWTHFLIHTGYQPRSELYRRAWRGHRLHHYRNEHYWLGVTSPVADLVLRTSPARDAVPVSTTAVRPEARPA
ncbi:sterol desaturase family protein [Frankia sp. CNm7]|uniref:Sterol desaturase family protein n=1 Tax=Frankia nepalensis TaxID=1836974 RepID=A0A937RGM7_9ACTN|nr:sterol desaturase family protein [Frankia nepalensis]MBL7499427.1 sterol desaturase family protein [Frankia nepalensis]MBL7516538.1 sterol desaturase family protein [Frankia nepalensis]MBL7522876.1 sterol desaturase family protein [Frankia nepalensis]MBL7631833.1 sterol desaturase family protein [Frankia nepalensis]